MAKLGKQIGRKRITTVDHHGPRGHRYKVNTMQECNHMETIICYTLYCSSERMSRANDHTNGTKEKYGEANSEA